LHDKYASEFEAESSHRARNVDGTVPEVEAITIGGKVVEEVGFEKIRRRLAQLQELKIVLLDGLCIAGVLDSPAGRSDDTKRMMEVQKIPSVCPKIVELDLSRNLLQQWEDVCDICVQLQQLQIIKLK
jgi:tubulin-specific chaperone E